MTIPVRQQLRLALGAWIGSFRFVELAFKGNNRPGETSRLFKNQRVGTETQPKSSPALFVGFGASVAIRLVCLAGRICHSRR